MILEGALVYGWSELKLSLVSVLCTLVIITSTILQAKFLKNCSETQKIKLIACAGLVMGGMCFVQMTLVKAFGSKPAMYVAIMQVIIIFYVILVPMVRDEGAVRCEHLSSKSQGKASGVLSSTRGVGMTIAPVIVSALWGAEWPILSAAILMLLATGMFMLANLCTGRTRQEAILPAPSVRVSSEDPTGPAVITITPDDLATGKPLVLEPIRSGSRDEASPLSENRQVGALQPLSAKRYSMPGEVM
jgi:hypothetical protein